MKGHVLKRCTTVHAASFNESKKTVIKLGEHMYNVRLEKKALVELLKKRSSELSVLKAEIESLKRNHDDFLPPVARRSKFLKSRACRNRTETRQNCICHSEVSQCKLCTRDLRAFHFIALKSALVVVSC